MAVRLASSNSSAPKLSRPIHIRATRLACSSSVSRSMKARNSGSARFNSRAIRTTCATLYVLMSSILPLLFASDATGWPGGSPASLILRKQPIIEPVRKEPRQPENKAEQTREAQVKGRLVENQLEHLLRLLLGRHQERHVKLVLVRQPRLDETRIGQLHPHPRPPQISPQLFG